MASLARDNVCLYVSLSLNPVSSTTNPSHSMFPFSTSLNTSLRSFRAWPFYSNPICLPTTATPFARQTLVSHYLRDPLFLEHHHRHIIVDIVNGIMDFLTRVPPVTATSSSLPARKVHDFHDFHGFHSLHQVQLRGMLLTSAARARPKDDVRSPRRRAVGPRPVYGPTDVHSL
ncbi:uncharacterized protein BDZ99DRAFT_11213 [Mytilinidion resinicola]|uniref:Uncharacterized protein n=1 Tax=Mytilinidion resinicola TaxID=574789 RepID=A0A6A6Z907_9PEZI|nr:uncharacterized protein BDZ99DRAFT_11213 [Mytilinidion resinicola]KAF2817213.1 hypothetical protein BDZ99DRAFT_11213 [Mytilinidion resinicola]